MGQNVNGILYGARVSPKWYMRSGDDNRDESGLLDKSDRALRRPPATDANQNFVGFWIAVRNGDDRGIPDLEAPVALDEVATTRPYAKALVAAKARWETFAAFAASEGVPMPPPKLWLVTTEVA